MISRVHDQHVDLRSPTGAVAQAIGLSGSDRRLKQTDVCCATVAMGRKRGADGERRDQVPLGEGVGNFTHPGVHSGMSILQTMCAAAMPHESTGGRQMERDVAWESPGNVAWESEVQFHGGKTRREETHDFHANSLLRTGHFVAVNNELARQRRNKEASSQLANDKTKEKPTTTGGVVQRDLRRVEVRSGRRPPDGKEEAQTTGPEQVSSGNDDGNGHGKPHRHDKSRQGMKEALKLAKAPNDLKKAKETFWKKFLASATLLAKNAKRRKIMDLLKATCGENHFPVNQEVILAISTALDEAQLQSGDQYVHELKLMHIEAGHDWSAPLERQLFLCNKALKRHRGPEVRARELQIKDINDKTWEEKCTMKGSYTRPAWMYALALAWMLKACEVTELRMNDVEVDFEKHKVGLRIRKSKTDQSAKGTLRTLACCGKQPCIKECPWALAIRLLAERPNSKPKDHLFGMTSGAKRTRAHTAKCWAKALHEELTGHSARRSGAMFYTRKGLDIQDISFLGRWRSSAVFRYMEEAMQERPMNTKAMTPTEEEAKGALVNHTQSMERWTNKLVGDGREPKNAPEQGAQAPMTPAPRTPAPGTPVPIIIPSDPEELALWATSCTKGRGKTTHYVTKASWQVDLNEWATACGWHFAQRSVKVSLSKVPPAGAKRCMKCEKVKELRDKVPEGVTLAQLVSNEMDPLLPSGTKARDQADPDRGQTDPNLQCKTMRDGGALGDGGGIPS